ncbi:hypothetical protein [Streptomyces abyssomicinicus]|uniref:hypothetical protein n=1 Tax=Streptomyces abyssomicinicus TaxID=574929 RepID=UPI00125031BD|nr:hypothetical protein [Streptomyces abyssomicinicus]
MTARQVIVVSPPGSGTVLVHEATTALGHVSRGTMSGHARHAASAGPGEVFPLLEAAYGAKTAVRLLSAHHQDQDTATLQRTYTAAVDTLWTLWRAWWQRLGQPVTAHTDLDPTVEARLTRLPDAELLRLLPGRDARRSRPEVPYGLGLRTRQGRGSPWDKPGLRDLPAIRQYTWPPNTCCATSRITPPTRPPGSCRTPSAASRTRN